MAPAPEHTSVANHPRDTAALPPRWTEMRTLLSIAVPLAAAYLAEFAIALTTNAIVGRLGYKELAAVGLAGGVASQIQIVLVGMLTVVGVLVAQAEGGGRKADAGIAARQGLFIALAVGLPAVVLVRNLDAVLALTGQDPEIVALMGPYLLPASGAIVPMLFYFVLRNFVAALAKTKAIMVITLLAVGLNYVLCLGLVEGRFGLPRLGVAGAGWAKTGVSLFMVAALAAYAYLTPEFRGYGLFRGRLKIDFRVWREILWLGIPVAAIVLLESGLFMAVSILSGVLGPLELATYQIIIAWVGLAFMTSHGIAEAGMMRVAHGAGRKNIAAARQSGILTMIVGVVWLTVLAAVPLSFPEPLVRAFLRPDDPGFQTILDLTSRLLLLAAFFQIFDGLQVIAALALRGLKDTVVPLWYAAIGYWVLGVSGGWLLAFPLQYGADGLWWGMAVGLTVTGSLLARRFLVLTHARATTSV